MRLRTYGGIVCAGRCLGAVAHAHFGQNDGVEIRFKEQGHCIDFKALTGRGITIYAQQEVVKDLIAGTRTPLVGSALLCHCINNKRLE
jgi:hypothetical protein